MYCTTGDYRHGSSLLMSRSSWSLVDDLRRANVLCAQSIWAAQTQEGINPLAKPEELEAKLRQIAAFGRNWADWADWIESSSCCPHEMSMSCGFADLIKLVSTAATNTAATNWLKMKLKILLHFFVRVFQFSNQTAIWEQNESVFVAVVVDSLNQSIGYR